MSKKKEITRAQRREMRRQSNAENNWHTKAFGWMSVVRKRNGLE